MASPDYKPDMVVDHDPRATESIKKDGQASTMSPEHRAKVEKSLKRKLDARCSLFVIIYIMNYLDRNNIAAARLGGLQEDLGINNTQYSTCLSIRKSSFLQLTSELTAYNGK
jgi:hypothetical protein